MFFPYCLQKLPDGRYIVLNRYYKPLGLPNTTDWVDYEKHPSAVKLRISAATAQKLSWEHKSKTSPIYLYNDATIPDKAAAHWSSYAERLKVLAKIQIPQSTSRRRR